jgi:hypothetical protein
VLKRSNVTAVSRTLEFQKPNAVCRIASGVGEGVFTVVDVANLPGVTSDECIEKRIDSLRFIESRIRSGECELARKKYAEGEANHLDGAINSRQLLSIDFLRSAFSE